LIQNSTMKYRIPLQWKCSYLLDVEADSLEEACNKAPNELEIIPEFYVDDSIKVDAHRLLNDFSVFVENWPIGSC
jgi:hypothetical protein